MIAVGRMKLKHGKWNILSSVSLDDLIYPSMGFIPPEQWLYSNYSASSDIFQVPFNKSRNFIQTSLLFEKVVPTILSWDTKGSSKGTKEWKHPSASFHSSTFKDIHRYINVSKELDNFSIVTTTLMMASLKLFTSSSRMMVSRTKLEIILSRK